ncbi:septum site-determining protein MinC [Candidatus Pantoea edessiphila]|uniref:Probable septum site-determining protein MinC n=1 Tax=Candidatus Pantoea edessiphila TaxID=2044610 RepID=A0A2P5T0R7_9GAMM|nr:septum site-determining protein MinC [Candidatus Pantoea edessiphila]PPI88175.1 septum site-determining protein MinC [Candidatus Pantoea edessiphila]
MSQQPIKFKISSFNLSVLYLYSHDPKIVFQAIKSKLKQISCFSKDIPVLINIDDLNHEVNWAIMKKAILAAGLCIVGVIDCKAVSFKKILNDIGLPILKKVEKQNKNNEIESKFQYSSVNKQLYNKTRIINLTVRSGQQIYSNKADLVIIGNVSAGAEVIADGNIHIYGIMRGRGLAGANGDNNCQIFCSNLAAELISIAGKYWVMDQIPQEFYCKSTCIYLKQGVLTIQKLN